MPIEKRKRGFIAVNQRGPVDGPGGRACSVWTDLLGINALRLGLVWLWLGVSSCAFSVDPTGDNGNQLTVELAAFPGRVSVEDERASAEIWATVKRGNKPVEDSTLVFFATTIGSITPSSPTQDGLAVAVLTGPGDGRPRRGEVVAQARARRDTIEVDFIIVLEE